MWRGPTGAGQEGPEGDRLLNVEYAEDNDNSGYHCPEASPDSNMCH